jgi:tetratricopeptide (TPR) repeat protein
LKHAQESGEDIKLAEAFHRHAYLLVYSNDYTGCLSACDQSVEAARRAGDRRLEVLCLSLQVPALVRSGQIKRARNTAREALDGAHELNDKSALIIALPRIGVYFFETGDLATYIELMSEEIQIARELGDRLAEAIGLSNIGESYSRLGLYRQARAHLEQAKAAAEAIGARRFRALAVQNLGSVLLQMGHLRKAEEPLQEALREFHAMEDIFTEERVQLELALVQEQAGDFAGAERRFLAARGKLEEMGIGDGISEANAGLARCALAQGHLDEARQYTREAAAFLRQEGATAENPFRTYRSCAEVWLALGENEAAKDLIREGWHELQTRANRLNNLEWRQSFLDNVPDNSAVTQLAQRLEVDGSILKDLQAAAGEVIQIMKEASPVTI